MKNFFRNRALNLVTFSLVTAVALLIQPVLAQFSQVTSTASTVSAAGSELSIADENEATFAGTVAGSLNLATGLQNNGLYKLAGFVDIKHTGTVATHYGIINPTPSSLTGANAVLDSNLKVVVYASADVASQGPTSSITYTCTSGPGGNTGGVVVVGETVGGNIMTPAAVAFSGLSEAVTAHPLPANGSGKRLCFYLGLPTTTPQTAATGTAQYTMTLTHN